MVAIAPPSRDAWPCTPNGETVSPTSARFLITTPSNGARTFAFSIASSVTRTRARADAMAASADFTRAADTAAEDFGGRQRRGGGDAILHQRALPIQVAEILVARRDRLTELRLAFRDGAPRRLELRVDIRVLDLGNHLALAHAGPLFEPETRQPAAHLDADVAAATRDHVAARHEHRQRRRTARRRHHLRRHGRSRPPARAARRRRRGRSGSSGRPDGRQHEEDGPRHPAPAPAGVPVDAQARQVAGRRVGMNCHGRVVASPSSVVGRSLSRP